MEYNIVKKINKINQSIFNDISINELSTFKIPILIFNKIYSLNLLQFAVRSPFNFFTNNDTRPNEKFLSIRYRRQ